jgi:hypothetical protein
MTVTNDIDHIVATLEDVSIETADKSAMTLHRTENDEKTGENSSVYILPSGDITYPATVTYRSSLNKRGGAPTRRISVTLSTWARSTDSVTGEVIVKPMSGTISMNIPTEIQVDLADVMQFLGNLFSFCYLSVTTKVRSTTWLALLLFGGTQVK